MTTRRRFVSIVACAPLATRAASIGPAPVVWRGDAMGALASMTLVHPDRARAQAIIARCTAEIDRLESVFSLYRPDSALSRLNAAGRLDSPPLDLVRLLSTALALAQRSGGAFDPTVQPLYRLYAGHFERPAADPAGPSAGAIERALRSVGHEAVALAADRIRLLRPGMAVTLNGIAQGYVTDRIAALLREAGMTDVLVDLGEARALGRHADGTAWRAAVADPVRPGRTLFGVALAEPPRGLPALATSAGRGTTFGPDARLHHLLDPRTGRSAHHHASVSVAAEQATLADGLSTALSIVSPAQAGAVLSAWPTVWAYFVDAQGRVTVRGASEPALADS